MSETNDAPQALAETMLAMVDTATGVIAGGRNRFAVTMDGATIAFGDGEAHMFERLGSAIEARIAFERATAMVAAAGEGGVPLWLVTGSDVLGKWLTWSRTGRALARTLVLTNQAGAAPVVGKFARRARRDLGQMSAKIRVFGGQAVAERIELSHRVIADAVLGDRATIRIARHHLPDTLLSALDKEPTDNDRWRASEIVAHPFFAAYDFLIAGVSNDGEDTVVELETSWTPLAPVPKAAWSAVPRDANPVFPWRATNREVAKLYALADRGERLLNVKD